MRKFKIDNYSVKERKLKTDSNYNRSINIFKDNTLIVGWHEKETIKDIEILEAAISSIKRYEKSLKAETSEKFLAI